jgi:hypothetical protein
MATAKTLVAVHEGVICTSADALAKLTLPDGSSRTTKPQATPEDIATKKAGGCMDIVLGERVTVITERRNTSVVTLGSGSDRRTYIVPNVDYRVEQTAQSQTSGDVDLHTEISRNCPKMNFDSPDFPGWAGYEVPLDKTLPLLTHKQQRALERDIKEHCGEAGLACPYSASINALISARHAKELAQAICAVSE